MFYSELKKAHVFIVPAITDKKGCRSNIPVELIEAVAFGRPIIATRHGGISEIVHEGKNGLLSPEKDASLMSENILTISSEVHLWRGFADYAHNLVQANFELRKQSEKLAAIYKQFIL